MSDKYVLATNDDGELAIRTVQATESSSVTDTTSVITATEDGKLAVRVVGAGGGGGGAVSSVNGKTGAVVLNAKDVNAVPQYTTMPTAGSTNVGEIAQFAGTTDATYTNGYFYVNKPTYTDSSATISQTTGSGLTDLAVDVATFESAEQPTGDETVNFVAANVSDSIDPTQFQFDAATIEIDSAVFLSNKTNIYAGDWANVARIYFSYDGDNDSFGAAAFDADNNELGNTGGLDPTFWGISVVSGTLPSSGSWGTNLYYTPAGTQWSKGGDTVTLADYGISFTGNPTDGDVLTVAYTAPVISGYAWEQIDVQPSSGGGQTIEYEIFDYAYGVDPSEVALYFELENLPTGDYYFYVKSLKNTYTQGGDAYGYQTNKISFHWDSSWNGYDVYPLVRALSVSPVLDGEYIGSTDQYSAFSTNGQPPLECYFNDNAENKFAIKLANWTMAQVGNIYHDESAIYKISKLYGGETPVSLGAQKIGRYDSITGYNYSANGGNTTPIVPAQVLPNKISQISFNVGAFAQTNQIILLSGIYFRQTDSNVSEAHISLSCSYGDFVANMIFNTNGNTEQQIIKATGPFAASRIRVAPSNGESYINIDNAAFAALQNQNDTVYVEAGIYGTLGGTEIYIGLYDSVQFPNYPSAVALPLANGSATYVLDTPTINEYKSVVQYVGETDANYTNGYFYKATGTIVTVPESITVTNENPNDFTVSITNIEGFITALANYWGVATDYIRNRMQQYSNYQVAYDVDNSTILEFQWVDTLSTSDPNVLQYLSVSTTGTYSGSLYVDFSGTYTPAHTEIQNAHWEQVNVQPSSALPSTTGLADGNYKLRLTMTSGVPTLSWVAE